MERNKKVIIIIFTVIIICGILGGVYAFITTKKVEQNENIPSGHVEDGKTQLIEKIKSVQDAEERKRQVDFALQYNIITQEEANRLY